MLERVQKILARAGIASRRKCEGLVAEGRVTINGRIARLGDKADAENDDIRLDGSRIAKAEQKQYFALNKPRGVVSTLSDPWARPCLSDLVPAAHRLYPVGRLDRDAEGLIIMTNDGRLANLLMHPRYEMPKTYEVVLAGNIDKEDVQRLRNGIRIDRRKIKPSRLAVETQSRIRITICEGRKHIVKRLFRKLGHTVMRLKRTQIANIALKGLPVGRFRELSRMELSSLMRLCAGKAEQCTGPAVRAAGRPAAYRA